MNTGTRLPIDRLATMRVTGANFAKAQPLADERVVKIEYGDNGLHILFQSCDKVRNRFVTLVLRTDTPNKAEWQVDKETCWTVNRPVPSRTGTASTFGGTWGEGRKVIPPARTVEAKPVTRWDDPEPSKMPLDPAVICKALQRLSSSHEWYYQRMVRDHGEEIAAPAYREGYRLYIERMTNGS